MRLEKRHAERNSFRIEADKLHFWGRAGSGKTAQRHAEGREAPYSADDVVIALYPQDFSTGHVYRLIVSPEEAKSLMDALNVALKAKEATK